jgi:hypothetical protein
MKNSKFNINTRIGRTERKTEKVVPMGGDSKKDAKSDNKPTTETKKKVVGKPNIEAIKQQQQLKKQKQVVPDSIEEEESEEEEEDLFEEIASILSQEKNEFLADLNKIAGRINPEDEDASRLTDLVSTLSKISDNGILVQTDTLSSLVDFCKVLIQKSVPFSGFTIHELDSNDVKRCSKMLEAKKYEFAVILSLSTQEVEIPIDELKDCKLIVGSSPNDVLDKYHKYCDDLVGIWPCIATLVSKKDKFLTIKVEEGKIRPGTVLVAVEGDQLIEFGRVMAMERIVNSANIVVKIDTKIEGETLPTHLYSNISRNSIDSLKKNHPDQVNDKVALLISKLKKILNIQ